MFRNELYVGIHRLKSRTKIIVLQFIIKISTEVGLRIRNYIHQVTTLDRKTVKITENELYITCRFCCTRFIIRSVSRPV